MKGFGTITRKYIGKPFKDCNCLQLIYNICADAGVELKTFTNIYNGHNINNYMPYWEKDPDNAIKDMIEVLKKTGKAVNVKFLIRGDIVVVQYQSIKFPAIYLGGSVVMMSTLAEGVMTQVVGKSFRVVMARRVFKWRD